MDHLAADREALDLLSGLPEASSLESGLRERVLDDRCEKLRQLLALARTALEGSDAGGTLEALATIDGLKPSAAEREDSETLRARAWVLLEQKQREASYERLMQAGDPLAAREVAVALLAQAGEADLQRRQAQVAAATAAARRAFGVWVSEVGHGDGGATWLRARPSEGPEHTCVVDLERRRTVRVVSTGWWVEPILGPGEARVAYTSDSDAELSVCRPTGTEIPGGRIDLPAAVRGAVVHPFRLRAVGARQ